MDGKWCYIAVIKLLGFKLHHLHFSFAFIYPELLFIFFEKLGGVEFDRSISKKEKNFIEEKDENGIIVKV